MKKYLFVVIKIGFVAGLFLLLFRPETFGFSEDKFQNISPGSLIEVLRKLDPAKAAQWLAFAVLVKFAGITCGIFRWRLLLHGQGIRLPLWYLAKCWFMGRAIGLFLPGTVGLDGYRLVETSVYTGRAIQCATVIAVEKLIGFIALGLLVFLSLPLAARLVEFNPAVLGLLLVGMAGFIVTAFLLLLNPRVVQAVTAALPTPAGIRRKVDELGIAVTAYGHQRALLLLAVVLGLGVHLAICCVLFGVSMAITGGTSRAIDVFAAGPLTILATVITPTVSGLGAREAAQSVLLGPTYGTSEAFLFGHLALWFGEVIQFFVSIPLLLFATRPDRAAFLADVESVQKQMAQGRPSAELAPELVARYRDGLAMVLIAGASAGLVGGAAVGLAEASWHFSTLSRFAETTAYWWGPAVYGIGMIPLGLGVAAGLLFLYLLADRFASAAWTFGFAVMGTAGASGAIIALFRYRRDILGEHALDPMQLATVLGGVATVALIIGMLGMLCVRVAGGGRLRGIVAALAAYALLVGSGIVLARTQQPVATPIAFEPVPGAAGPNVVFIAVDTLRADFLKAYNASARPNTPNVDALAKDSVLFEKMFAQSSWTKASFGTIFSGMYPEAHTATGKASSLPGEVDTFAEVFQQGGYYTQGYSNNPNIVGAFNYGQGFAEYVDLKPNLYFGARASCEKLVGYDVLRKVVQRVYKQLGNRIVITDFYQPAEVVTDTGLGWIDGTRRPKDAPFLLFLHYMDPHDPFRDPKHPGRGYARAQMANPDPEVYLEAFLRSYSYEVEWMDREVGRLLDGLRERNLYNDTLIVFTSDHGEEFHEHGGWWHGLSLYDEQIAVPLIIKLPGNTAAGSRNPNLARHVDIAPTLAQLAGQSSSPQWQGKPLFAADASPANADIGHIYAHLDFEGIQLHAVRTMTRKLIEANEGNKRGYAPVEFYDITADPAEKTDLAKDASAAAAVESLAGLIVQMKAFVLEHRAEPVVSTETMDELKERLESTGYLSE